jgi:hypothetical protein
MRAPILADSFVILVHFGAAGLIVLTPLRLPIAPDFHVFSTAAIPFTGLVGLLRRLCLFNGSGLRPRGSHDSACRERENQCRDGQQ